MKFDKPYLNIADSHKNTNMYYLSGMLVPDPFIYFHDGNEAMLCLSALEVGRARKESRVSNIYSYEDWGFSDFAKQHGKDAFLQMIIHQLKQRKISTIVMPADTHFGFVEKLNKAKINVEVADSLVEKARRTKTDPEIANISESQAVTGGAMSLIKDILGQAVINKNHMLYIDGEPLTSEYLQGKVAAYMIERGCFCDGLIIAGGLQGADPHSHGHGHLPAYHPIVCDIFPIHMRNRYYSDMTRTFVKGNLSKVAHGEELMRMYDTVAKAQDAAFKIIKAGVSVRDVHNAVCDTIEFAGYYTLRNGRPPDDKPAMIHSTGHGIGLDVHEAPSVSSNDFILEAGNVITVEPGLYHPDWGGIRIEDMVVVRDEGHTNLTNHERIFVVE